MAPNRSALGLWKNPLACCLGVWPGPEILTSVGNVSLSAPVEEIRLSLSLATTEASPLSILPDGEVWPAVVWESA